MKNNLIFLAIMMTAQLGLGQSLTTSSYTEDMEDILNPERGFYKHTDSHNGYPSVFVNPYTKLTSAELDSYLADGITLVLRLFYIHEFANQDSVSVAYRADMQADFDLLRQKGMKAIVRFAYSNLTDSLDLNVTPERIDGHLKSVKSVLATNQDVILVVQSGLIGTWGEWYYTNNFGNAGTITESDYVKRFQVITSLLEHVPAGIMVQLRTPFYKTRYLEYIGESTSAVTASEAYNPALVKARLGHHNDCILSTPDGRIHVVTIPKTAFSSLSSTITVGYRGIKDNALWAGTTQSQLPAPNEAMADYVIGSQSFGSWDNVPNVLTFANGTVQEFKVADDATNLYIRVKESGYLATGKDRYEVFINTDNNTSTGWIDAGAWTATGADYLLQKALDQGNILYSHTGVGNGWTWTQVASPGISATLEYSDSFDDQGTFSTTDDITFVADDSKYVMNGGETCLPTNQNDCAKSETRLAYHHYTYLNSLYQPDVLAKWDTQGCLDEITQALGYRLRLNSASIQGQVAAGGKLFVSLDVTNLGYAAPAKLRPLNLILRDTVTLSEYSIAFESVASDVRTWLTGNVVFNESLTMPATIPVSGAYKAFLSLPDAASNLATNSSYSIRFANQNTWEPATGYNALDLGVEVLAAGSPSTPSIVVDGSLTDWSDVDAIGFGTAAVGSVKAHDIADTLFISAGGTLGDGFNLYLDADGQSYTGYAGWAEGADYKLSADKLFRFEFGEDWVEISSAISYVQNSGSFEVKIPKSLLYGLDETVKIGYENLASGASAGRAPSAGNLFSYTLDFSLTVPRPVVSITADGSSSDWAYVDPLVQKATGDLSLLKVYDDKSNVYLLIKGSLTNTAANYQMFMNSDGNTVTGLIDPGFWTSTGADYALLSGLLYAHDSVTSKANNAGNPNAWAWTSAGSMTIQTSADSSTREMVVPKSSLNTLLAGSAIDVGYRKLNGNTVLDKLPSSGGLVRYTIETPYVKDLESMVISDDVINLTLTVQGGVISTTYESLLDTDNNAITGYGDGASIVGADFLIQNGILYSYGGDGTSWVWNPTGVLLAVADTQIDANVSQREISIPKSGLSLTTSNAIVNAVYKSTVNWAETARLPEFGMQAYTTTKAYIPELQTYTLSDDGTNIYLTVEGSHVIDTYEAFINIDNNTTTGYVDATWTTMGADYLIKDGILYQYSGVSNAWGWTPIVSAVHVINTQVTTDIKKREIVIPRVSLTSLAVNDIIASGYRNIVGINLGAYIPDTGGMKPYTVLNNYVPDLQQMVIADDASNIYVTVTGGILASTYDLYINSDESTSTGYYVPAWGASGADLLIQNGTLYDYTGTNNLWGWATSASSATVVDTDLGGGVYQRQFTIPRAAIDSNILTIAAGYGNTSNGNIEAQLPADGDMQAHVLTPLVLTIGEVGKITNDQTNEFEWTKIDLANTYVNPVVIMSPLSYNGSQPATLRVRDVTSTSFKYQIDEWDYLNGSHVEENIFYLVVEAGTYVLDGGVTLQAGNTSSDYQWSSTTFNQTFATIPLVFAQTTTSDKQSAVTTRVRYIGNDAFDLRIQEEEGSTDNHMDETVSWVALSEGLGNVGRTYEVDGTSRNYDHIFFEKYFTNTYDDPILFAHMQTSYGGDACALRYDDLGVDIVYFKVEEEKSADFEINHTNEEIGFMVFDSAGIISGKEIYQATSKIRGASTIEDNLEEGLESNVINKLVIYPNPATNIIKVSGVSEGEPIQIYNMIGRLVLQISDIEINISGLGKGVYFLKTPTQRAIRMIKQ